jgi:two-component sensor histidine kinase
VVFPGDPSKNKERRQPWDAPERPAGFLILIAAAIFVPLAFFTVGASSAWNAAEEETVTSLERVTNLLHEHALRAFETHEAMMTALDQRVEGFMWPLPRERQTEVNAFLSALRRSAIPVSGLAIVDPDNRIAAGSFTGQAAPSELRDPAFIARFRKQTSRIMVSPVMRSTASGAQSFAIMRRHITPQDEESGLIVSLFDVSFFESFYQPLRRERGDMIALLRADGENLVMSRIDDETGDTGANTAARILKLANGANATLRTPDLKGRPDMLFMVRRIADYPIYLVQGRSLANIKQQWLLRIAPYALLLLTSTSFMLLLIWRMAGATRREQEAYARLAVEEANHSAKTQSNVRMKRLMDTNVFGVVTFTEKGVIEANDAFLVMVGKTRATFKATGFTWLTKTGHDLSTDDYIKAQLLRRGSCPPFETEILIGESNSVPVLIGATLYEREPLIWTCFVLDLTERREREAQQIFIMRELNHRTKNLLTVIRSIAGQIARTGTGWDDFRDRFNNRLSALAGAHDLLVDSNWRGAELVHLVRSQFSQFHDLSTGQITVTGQDINLSPRAAQAIGMGLYELLTNAVKYGALSSQHGHIDVRWDITIEQGDAVFIMHWVESGGPPVEPPTHRGFGHIVIAEMTSRTLQGEVVYAFPPEGVEWTLMAPLDAIAEASDASLPDLTDKIRAA